MTQNIYQQLGLKQVINACGKMTILGVSSVAPEVMQATARAASAFVEIDRLVDRTGERVSRFTGAEDSYITSCASASPPAPRRESPSPWPPRLPMATRRE